MRKTKGKNGGKKSIDSKANARRNYEDKVNNNIYQKMVKRQLII